MPSNTMGNMATQMLQSGKGSGKYEGIHNLLNIRAAFKDAQRLMQYKDQQEAAKMASAERQTAMSAGYIQPNIQPDGGMTYQNASPATNNMETIPDDMEVAGYNAKGMPYLRRKARMSDAERRSYDNAQSLGVQIADLKAIVREDQTQANPLKKAQAPGVGVFTIQGQRYRKMKTDILDRLVRMRSGAQINEQEFKRLKGLLPSIFVRDAVDLEQLDKFEAEFKGVLERIETGRAGMSKSGDTGQDPEYQKFLEAIK